MGYHQCMGWTSCKRFAMVKKNKPRHPRWIWRVIGCVTCARSCGTTLYLFAFCHSKKSWSHIWLSLDVESGHVCFHDPLSVYCLRQTILQSFFVKMRITVILSALDFFSWKLCCVLRMHIPLKFSPYRDRHPHQPSLTNVLEEPCTHSASCFLPLLCRQGLCRLRRKAGWQIVGPSNLV